MVIKWPPRRRRKAVDRFDRSFASKSSPNSGMVYQRQLSETEFLNGGSNMTTLHRTSNELKEKYRNDGRVCSHRFLHVSHTSRALSCIQNEWRFLDDGGWDGRGQFSYVWRSILASFNLNGLSMYIHHSFVLSTHPNPSVFFWYNPFSRGYFSRINRLFSQLRA